MKSSKHINGAIPSAIQNYVRASQDEPSMGLISNARTEPSLDLIRDELAESISRVVNSVFNDKYGPLLGAVSQPAVNEFLKGFELKVSRAKGDATVVFEELLDRVIPKNQRNKN